MVRKRAVQRTDGTGIYHPVLEITLRGCPAGNVMRYMLVDSGADTSCMPEEFLAGTGIDYSTLPVLPPSTGVGGTAEARYCAVELWFERWKFADGFTVLKAGSMPQPMCLLGRQDFMKRFQVSFDWRRDPPTFDVRPYP